MFDKNGGELQSTKYSRTNARFHRHRPWFIYNAATELEKPFSLHQLQDAVYEKAGIRPRKKRLLAEARNFYDQHDISIINRTEPEADSFTVNQYINLDNPRYASIIRSPREHRGRPRKDDIQDGRKPETCE